MRLTRRNILEIVLESVCLLMLFIPGVFTEEYWKWDKGASTSIFGVNYHGVMSLERETGISFFEAMLETTVLMKLFGFLVFAALIATIVLLVKQLIASGEGENSLLAVIGSAVSLAVYMAFTVALIFTEQDYINYELSYDVNWLVYIHIALFAASALVCLVGYIHAKKHGVAEEKTAPVCERNYSVPGQSVADELLKYKELMDAGAISEEEFLAIKKKLL